MAFFEGIKMTGGYGNGPDIINSCSVDVNRGEIVSILGPNGAGKSTVIPAKTFFVWGTNEIPALTLSCGESFEISFPSITTEPDFKSKRPSIAFIAVDFPAPLGPRIETISPLLTSTEQELIILGPLP